MKYCSVCGNELREGSNFCTACGSKITNEVNNQPGVKPVDKKNKEATVYGVTSLILHFCMPILSFLFSGMSELSLENSSTSIAFGGIYLIAFLSSYVVLIVGRVKHPDNAFLKVIMWIYIVLIITSIIGIILIFAFCYMTCNSIDLSKCN